MACGHKFAVEDFSSSFRKPRAFLLVNEHVAKSLLSQKIDGSSGSSGRTLPRRPEALGSETIQSCASPGQMYRRKRAREDTMTANE